MNEFVSWCRHLLVPFLFHDLTSLHPPSFQRNDFSTCIQRGDVILCEALFECAVHSTAILQKFILPFIHSFFLFNLQRFLCVRRFIRTRKAVICMQRVSQFVCVCVHVLPCVYSLGTWYNYVARSFLLVYYCDLYNIAVV